MVIQHVDHPPFAIKVHDLEYAKMKIEGNLEPNVLVNVSKIDINDI